MVYFVRFPIYLNLNILNSEAFSRVDCIRGGKGDFLFKKKLKVFGSMTHF